MLGVDELNLCAATGLNFQRFRILVAKLVGTEAETRLVDADHVTSGWDAHPKLAVFVCDGVK